MSIHLNNFQYQVKTLIYWIQEACPLLEILNIRVYEAEEDLDLIISHSRLSKFLLFISPALNDPLFVKFKFTKTCKALKRLEFITYGNTPFELSIG